MLIDVSMKSLRGRLAEDEQLVEAAARLWGVDPAKQDRAATISRLTERMQDAFWARGVWEHLADDEQVCLFQALTTDDRGKGAPWERLRKRTKLSPPVFETAVTHLLAYGLLEEGEVLQRPSVRRAEVLQPISERAVFCYRECAQGLHQTGQERFTAFLDRTTMSLDRLVGARSWEQLQDLGRLCHVPSRQMQQIRLPFELQRSVGEALTQPLVVFDLLHRVDMQAQQFFLWLCGNGGKASIKEALAFAEGDKGCLRALLRKLETHALVFDTLTHSGQRVVFIQEALYAAAKGEAGQYADDERAYAFFPVSSAPAVIREAQPHLCYDLAVIIGSVCQNRIEPTKDDAIPKRLVTKIRPLLHGQPRIGEEQADLYVDMLFRAARSLELLHSAIPYGEEKPRYELGPKLPQWAQLSTVEQLRQFLAWWPKSTTWYDVRPDGKLLPSTYTTHTARRTLLGQLQGCVPGQLYPTDALLYALWRQQPILLYEGLNAQQSPARRTSLRGRRELWMQGEGLLYTALLCSTLFEAGIITLGHIRTRETEGGVSTPPQFFQVTPLGAAVLADAGRDGTGEQAEAVDQKMLIVQPNYDVIVREPHHWSVLYQVLKFAQIVHIGPVSTFKLTQSALLRGIETGLSAEQVLTFLAQHCRHNDVPQNVAYTIREDWPKGYQVANLAEVILIELSSEQRADDLQRALVSHGCEVRKLAPCLFAVTPNGHSFLEIKRALEKSGLVVRGQPSLSVRRW